MLFVCCAGTLAHAAEPTAISTELGRTIAGLDRKFFDAFNACDMATMRGNLLEPGVEFYQDNDDTTYFREISWDPHFRDRCAPNNVSKLRRELILGSMEIYPLKDYGALEIARHNFIIVETGKLAASPRMVVVWRNDSRPLGNVANNQLWPLALAIDLSLQFTKVQLGP